MCVIVLKPSDVEPVSEEVLRQCWEKNSDGAGYAVYMGDNKWSVKKGFMKWKQFIKAFRKENVTKENAYVCHFRIKSAGGINKGNTHPFIICDDYRKMKKLSYITDGPVLFHNGTCGMADGDASDTMNYIKHYISPLVPYMNDGKIKTLFNNLLQDTKDKWLLIHGNSIIRFNKFEKHEGSWFSNLWWKPYKPIHSTPTTRPYTSGNGFLKGWGHNVDWSKYDKDQTTVDNEIERNGYAFADVSYNTEDEIIKEYSVIWDDCTKTSDEPPKETETNENDGYVTCPYCYEENYIGNAEFVNAGDSFCWRCGCCFDEQTKEIYMHEYELKEMYDRENSKKDGTHDRN